MDSTSHSLTKTTLNPQIPRSFSRLEDAVDNTGGSHSSTRDNKNDETGFSSHVSLRRAKTWDPDSKPFSSQHDGTNSDSRPNSSLGPKMQTITETPNSLPADVFEANHRPGFGSEEEEEDTPEEQQREGDALVNDNIPIDILYLTDRFINSLKAKTYSSPPTVETLSELFQNFYVRASEEIRGEKAPQTTNRLRTVSSFSLLRPSSRQRNQSPPESTKSTEHQMLTPGEIAERRRTRKIKEQQRKFLEEAVERNVCESVYDKTWCHRSSLDAVRDEKLRSKTAALSLVGITLKELGIPITLSETEEGSAEKNEEIRRELQTARDDLVKMNEKRYPLGKLQHLVAAHRSIVTTLTKALPSNSSADEILPTLIYTLITSPTEGINIIANFLYIQRFRMASKLNGEAAYCMANLEAAISFLENVDLSSLRKGENITSSPNFMTDQSTTETSTSSTSTSRKTLTVPKSEASDGSPQRRFSELFQPPVKALEAANDAVRSTADQGLKNLSNSFENLNNVVFGRFREMQTSSPGGDTDAVAPKTLDDARKLVSDSAADSPGDIDDKNGNASSFSGNTRSAPLASQETPRNRSDSTVDNSFMGLISGRRTRRSNSMEQQRLATNTPNDVASGSSYSTGSLSKFNPLSHIPEIMIRGFSRPTPESSVDRAEESVGYPSGESPDETELGNNFKTDLQEPNPSEGAPPAAEAAPETAKTATTTTTTTPFPPLRDIEPPIQHFLDLEDASNLKLGEVSVLLDDYKRVASALNDFLANP